MNAAVDVRHEGPVAQRLEQGTHNPLVGGSNPSGPTKITPDTLNKVNDLIRRPAHHFFRALAQAARLRYGYGTVAKSSTVP
jgi:hypothetical protein